MAVLFLASSALAQTAWPGAVLLKQGLDLNGNSVAFDSFNSSDPTKSTAGHYNASKYSGDQGNVMAATGIADSLSLGTLLLYGTLHTGPSCTVTLGAAGAIGPHGSQVHDVTTARSLGYILADANCTFPDTTLPSDYASYQTPMAGTVVTWSNTILSWTTNSPEPPSTPPRGGTQTNVAGYTYSTNYPTPVPPGLTTNTSYTIVSTYPTPPPPGLSTNAETVSGSSTLPSPLPAEVTTNYTTAVTTTSDYPFPDTYLGTVITNYNGPHIIKSYTYNAILSRTYDYTAYTYTYPFYTYGVPYYTYSYNLYQTNTVYSTNSYDYVLNANTRHVANSLAGRTCVAGTDVVLVLPNGLTGAETFVFAAGANLVLYAGGSSATLVNNQVLGLSCAANFTVFCTPSVTRCSITGDGELDLVLVAPSADVAVNASPRGSSLCGTLLANSLRAVGTVSFHYDEALGRQLVFPPAIACQPLSQSALPGSSVTLAVLPTFTTPRQSYQWRRDGTLLPGATSSTLTLQNVQSQSIGSYDVVIHNEFGSVTSQTATVSLVLAPDYLWACNGSNVLGSGAMGGSWADALVADAQGHVLVAGRLTAASLDLGGRVLDSTAGNNFLCQYDSSGTLQWARLAGFLPAGFSPHLRVGTDAAGNAYFAGHFTGTADFGALELTNAGTADFFLAKFSPQGQALWARRIGAYDPQDYSPTFGFAVDPAGNVFLAGSYAGVADFGTLTLSGTGGFLARYDAAGNLVWASGAPAAQALAVGPSGALCLSVPAGLAKYDAQGNQLWSKPFPRATALAVDQQENLYATGNGAGTYDELPLTNCSGLPDFFVAKCDPAGTLQWLRQVGSTTEQRGLALALDGRGGLYVGSVSGEARRDPVLSFGAFSLSNVCAFVAEYDTAGTALWAKPLVTSGIAAPWGLDALGPGLVGVAGHYRSSLTLGGFSFSEAPNSLGTLFVAKLAGLAPPQLGAPRPLNGAAPEVAVTGADGFHGVVEGSSNLRDWTPLVTNTLPFTFTDAAATNCPSRYYRVTYQP